MTTITKTKKLSGIASILVIGSLVLAACGPEAATPTTGTSSVNTTVPAAGTTPTEAGGVTADPTISGDGPTTGVSPVAGTSTPMTEATPGMMETPGMSETPGMMETPGAISEGDSIMVMMGAQNDSGQSGMATVTDLGNGKVNVVLDITGPGSQDPQPAHIHLGTCANLDPSPAFPLSSVVDGKSVTEIEANFADFATTQYAINVHKSAAEASVYVSCGDIAPGEATSGETPASGGMMGLQYNFAMNAQNNSGQTGRTVITDLGNGMISVAIDITADGVTDPQPAHIHQGTCAQLDPQPAYPLNNVVDGKSVTEVEADFDVLTATAFAVNIHKSAAEASTYVACGDITESSDTEGTPPPMMMETPMAEPTQASNS